MASECSTQRGASPDELGAARDLIANVDCIDLHTESFIWSRFFGYRLTEPHGRGLFNGCFMSQFDIPRAVDVGMTGVVASIATNPFRTRSRRTPTFLKNLHRLRAMLGEKNDDVAVVASYADYMRAKEAGLFAVWLGVQGGNALDSGPDDIGRIPDDIITRITLVHLRKSTIGSSNAPGGGKGGLTSFGRDYVKQLNTHRVLVDLSHINEAGFWDAIEESDSSQPVIVSHTGLSSVRKWWRNIDDKQVKAIADTGGVVGIIFHNEFVGREYWRGSADAIVDNMEHLIRVAGEDFVALGSDWDGMIITPREMRTVSELPVLVAAMLRRNWSESRIAKILGHNYLRVIRHIRPE